MPSPWQYALMVGPLGFYFWAVAVRNSGRRPVVVGGLFDHALLCFGVGGVVAFGPFGRLVARSLFGTPDPVDWLALLSAFGLFACWLTFFAAAARASSFCSSCRWSFSPGSMPSATR